MRALLPVLVLVMLLVKELVFEDVLVMDHSRVLLECRIRVFISVIRLDFEIGASHSASRATIVDKA